jgi:hypothetical protein
MRKLRGVVILLFLNLSLALNSFAQDIIKDDFKVNDDTLKLDQDMPDIDVDDLGNLVIVWQDPRNSGTDIFAQRLNLSGEVLGGNLLVNNIISGFQKCPSVACEASGNFIVVWQDSREGNRDIYAQRFDSSGDTLDSNFKINDDSGTKPQIEPEVAFSAKIAVVWGDERYDSGDIFAQLFVLSGQPEGTNFRINDDSYNSIQLRADVSSDFNRNFVVVWQDKREGNYDIFSQRFDSSGNFLNNNFKVNDDMGNSLQNFPRVDSDSTGNFVVVWQDKRNGDEDVYAQRYDSNFNPLVHNFRVNSDTGSAEQSEPKVATNGKNIYFTWVDNRNGDSDIYAKVVDWNWTDIREIKTRDDLPSFALLQNFPNPFNITTTIPFTVHGKLKTANRPIHTTGKPVDSGWLLVDSPNRTTSKLVDGYWLLVDRPIHTTLKIYNVRGQLVRTLVDEDLKPEAYTVIWDGRNNKGSEVASGIYFCRLKIEDYTETRKMLLLK